MKAVVVSIGDELVQGLYPDLNASSIAQRLFDGGVLVDRFLTVPDETEAIAAALREAAALAPLVVATGGLGPPPTT